MCSQAAVLAAHGMQSLQHGLPADPAHAHAGTAAQEAQHARAGAGHAAAAVGAVSAAFPSLEVLSAAAGVAEGVGTSSGGEVLSYVLSMQGLHRPG